MSDARTAELSRRHRRAAAAGRVTWTVPASGAATRMFRDLLAWRDGDDEQPSAAVRELAENLAKLPLAAGLSADAGDLRALVDALVSDRGRGFASQAKGLLPFHSHPDGARTAFAEHLDEAARLIADEDGRVRVHVTVSPAHRKRFELHLEETRPAAEKAHGVRIEVSFSEQDPATDTLALDPETGAPFRTGDGELVLRPAGHGALIGNLNALDADLVFLKNIDNVIPDKRPVAAWTPAVIGAVVELEARVHACLRALDAGGQEAVADARALLEELGYPAAGDRDALRAQLDRPLRACGMVPDTGETGGGPFWVRGRDGAVTRQVVETAQVDLDAPAQVALVRASTHFNPVFLALALRDYRGRKHDLTRFVDQDAVIVATKSHAGRTLKALERPGLWNGAMAEWLTVFVEVPAAVFVPVKTVSDLLRPEHQPRERSDRG